VEYKLVTNLAISQHRLVMLQRLTHHRNVSLSGKDIPFSGLEILGEDNRASPSSNSDLLSVRVKVRCPIRSSIKDIEKSLFELTIPSMETDECQAFAKQLHREGWLLESCMHSIKRLELDLEHDKQAVEIDSVAAQESGDSSAVSPFRLTSFGATEHSQQTQSSIMDNLKRLAQVRSENLGAMVTMLERLKAKSRGFLSMTGSPMIEPVVRPMTAARFIVLFLMCALVWVLLMTWLHPGFGHNRFRIKTLVTKRNSSSSSPAASPTNSFNSDQSKTILWMQRAGIPYLGEVQVWEEEFSKKKSIPLPHIHLSETSSQEFESIDPKIHLLNSVKWLRSLGDGSLVLWIGLLVARFMFDPIWRELLSVAPLAAISRMISGIQ